MEAGHSQGSRTFLERLSRLAVFYELTKPGIAGYVMVTAGVGYMVAAGGQADFLPVIWTLLGTVLSTGGALAQKYGLSAPRLVQPGFRILKPDGTVASRIDGFQCA